MDMVDPMLAQTDHDLLIRVDENLRNLRLDFQTLTGDTTKKIDDHESRIRFIEKYVWAVVGLLGAIQVVSVVIGIIRATT